MQILEIKQTLDGRQQSYRCEVINVAPGRSAVVRFETGQPYRDGPVQLPKGRKITYGFFWSDRHYLVYRLLNSENALLGHRFDICDEVLITPERIHWTDLVLDLWVDVENRVHVLDRQELLAKKRGGLVSDRQWSIVVRTEAYLRSSFRAIMAELGAILASSSEVRTTP